MSTSVLSQQPKALPPGPLTPLGFHPGQVRMQTLAGTRDYAAHVEPYFTNTIDLGLQPLIEVSPQPHLNPPPSSPPPSRF